MKEAKLDSKPPYQAPLEILPRESDMLRSISSGEMT